MTWRLAASLDTLRRQIDAARPARRRDWDGTIGDAAHAARTSDHNPNSAGVVTAIDITHDPAGGVDTAALAEHLRGSRDPRIKYVISNGRIVSSTISPWTWRPYTGASRHDKHVHISVMPDASAYDDARPWDLPFGGARPAATAPPATAPPPGRQRDITATVFGGPGDEQASAYGGRVDPDRPGVALPFRFPGARPKVRVTRGVRSVVCDVVDVGPWYPSWRGAADPYWTAGARPRAEGDGRTNRAGIDLTPAAAAAIGLPGKGLVDWEFVTPLGSAPPNLPTTAGAGAVVIGSALAGLPLPVVAGAAAAALVLLVQRARHSSGDRSPMLKSILAAITGNKATTTAGTSAILLALAHILTSVATGDMQVGALLNDLGIIAAGVIGLLSGDGGKKAA
ncbi:hypothetical protein RHODGE_RHODGE_03336 [Rhodoplanes serenus]|uniref:Uncharacterized protein n=1 Tax=Rhodoplanes serenus TaxID=200615 RepID=A0A3S4FE99_9BRAD|nr:hypothetical protein [Rhodoplanes serenus]VCU10150.1 hypothetical protein RHODGE_RHODGE_03336 [Rhodoplanes serenus]